MQHFIHFVASLTLTFYISEECFKNFSLFSKISPKNILTILSITLDCMIICLMKVNERK